MLVNVWLISPQRYNDQCIAANTITLHIIKEDYMQSKRPASYALKSFIHLLCIMASIQIAGEGFSAAQ